MKYMNIRYYVILFMSYFILAVMNRPVLAIVFGLMAIVYYLHLLVVILTTDKNINVTFKKKGDQNERTER